MCRERPDLVITNARIVDPASRTVTQGALWIENGRIAGRAPEAPANARGARIDIKGRWVVPGFNDLHTHSFGNAAPGNVLDNWGTESTAIRVPRAGVTAFLDLFDDEDTIFGVIQGYSLHRELVLLVEAGLSTWDTLGAATTRAGEFLGRRFGVEPGDVANLVVVDASPIDDIANTQRIEMVVLRGRVVYDAATTR